MNNLIIEGSPKNIAKDPSIIKANEELREIQVQGSLADIAEEGFLQLENWIQNYQKWSKRTLRIDAVQEFTFALPKDKLIYSKYYTYSEKCRTQFSKILEKLSIFNLYIGKVQDKYTLTFYGNMDEGVIKFEGEFFPNYTDIFIVPIINWFELFFEP